VKDHFRCNEPQQKRLNSVIRDLPNYFATSRDTCRVRVFCVVPDLRHYSCCCVSSVNTTLCL